MRASKNLVGDFNFKIRSNGFFFKSNQLVYIKIRLDYSWITTYNILSSLKAVIEKL